MPFNCRAMRFMRAKGEGVADMRVSGSEDMFKSWSCVAAKAGVGRVGLYGRAGLMFREPGCEFDSCKR